MRAAFDQRRVAAAQQKAAELVVPFGETVTVTLPQGLLDLPELPDNEYYGPVAYEYRWNVPGGPSGTGRTAVIPSSAAGGPGVIGSPGNYSVEFMGKATYTVRRRENGVERSSKPREVPLTASPGGRLSLPFRLVGVASLSCEGVTSTTDTAGNNETLVIPVGYNSGSVTLTAMPTPSGDWPAGYPAWNWATPTAQDPAVATLSTATPGTYTVTAECGNTIGLTVQVIGVSGLTARRADSGDSFGESATITAGGKSSDVHKAEIKILLWPIPLKQATLTFPASLSGAAAHQGTDVAAVLTCGASTLTGNTSGTVTLGAIDLTEGTAAAELKSSNVTRLCTATIGGSSVNVSMVWDISGFTDFEYNDYFFPGIENEVAYYPTLDEMALHDEDNDGTAGEGAIDGHNVEFWRRAIHVKYWRYDWSTFEYVDEPQEKIVIANYGENPVIEYNQRISYFLDISETEEHSSGKYTSAHTVYDYIDCNGSVETVIEVLGYQFWIYDWSVYGN